MRLLDFERPLYDIEKRLEELRKLLKTRPDLADEIRELEARAKRIRQKIYANLTPWQIVQVARHADRPHALDYIQGMATDFLELHGDRYYGDDPAIVAGLIQVEDQRWVVVGEEKGRDVKERVHRNFGMPNPEGYRKAERMFRLADKFGLPIVTLIDTPGAFPGIEAEERGQSRAIATAIQTMLEVRVPIVAVVIGEGGSGGALAIGVGNRVLMLEYAIYSVISPEGCAAILWKDGAQAPKAAEVLRLTSRDLHRLGVVDEVIPEPPGGAHRNPEEAIQRVKEAVLRHLADLQNLSPEEVLAHRRQRFLRFGEFVEARSDSADPAL